MTINGLQTLLDDPGINEVMWNSFNRSFIEFNGTLKAFPSPLRSAQEYDSLVAELSKLQNTVSANGLSFDGILPDGSRFHVTLPPLSPHGATLTIRKFSRVHRNLQDLVASNFITSKLAIFLEACVRAKINILISGATGAGKTTLMNCLASLIPASERIVTIEDIPELQLRHANWIRLLSVRSERSVTVRDCVVGSLRMRPDRIIIGECRSNEALEMLQAMNTGHDGGMTTVHANSSGDALTRLESLILFHSGAEIPIRPLRKQIVDALDIIIQIKRSAGGQRFVEEVLEVVGMEGDIITRLPIFKRPENKMEFGKTVTTGHPPHFLERMQNKGIILPKTFFDPQTLEDASANNVTPLKRVA